MRRLLSVVLAAGMLLAPTAVASSQAASAKASAAEGRWTPLPTSGAPCPRTFDSAVWAGAQMIIWGGVGCGTIGREGPGNGARYLPATDQWQPVATAGAPSVRVHQTAVWTGTRMLIWGGVISTFIQSSGASYDPAADRWTPLGRTNNPTGRYGHTAVWTGTAMLIWGGNPGSAEAEQGAQYIPASDEWTPLPDAPFLSQRWYHTVVWTGTEMLVWGGEAAEGQTTRPQGDGGRYTPTTNTWAPIAAASAPGPRYGHTAIWTGTEMLIWGGVAGTPTAPAYLGDGAAYNPATNSWRPLPTAGAPSPRGWHSAVWTGSQMLVWGGEDAAGTLGDGAAYDPATNSWTPLPPAGAPSPRAWASAVWTGAQILVWGGCSACDPNGLRYVPLGDGAAYTPASSVSGGPGIAPETGGGGGAMPAALPRTGAGGMRWSADGARASAWTCHPRIARLPVRVRRHDNLAQWNEGVPGSLACRS